MKIPPARPIVFVVSEIKEHRTYGAGCVCTKPKEIMITLTSDSSGSSVFLYCTQEASRYYYIGQVFNLEAR